MWFRYFSCGRALGCLCAVFFLCGGCLAPSALAAPDGEKAAPPKLPLSSPPSKAPDYEAVRSELFSHLEEKAGSVIVMPAFPQEKLIIWIDERSSNVAPDDKARYTLLEEHLLIAQKLLESPNLPTRKRGFWIASESANFAAAQLKTDKWLLARIYEGFLLPNVTLANVELWRDPSRSRILESGVSAFGNAGEPEKQTRVLEWIISIGERKVEATPKKGKEASEPLLLEVNTVDWARGTLAALLMAPPKAKRPELERALTLFKSIQSLDMTGFKHLQDQVQNRLDKMPTTGKLPKI